MLEVVARRNQFLFETGQQLWIAGRIVRADVVRLLNDAASQQPRPGAVDDVAREPRIVRPGQPAGEHLARIPVRQQSDRRAVRKGCQLRRIGHGLRVGRGGIEEDNFLLPFRCGFVTDVREKRREICPLFLRPVINPRSHERQRHGLRDSLRAFVLQGAVKIDRRHGEVAAAGREQVADELVIRLIFPDAVPNPLVIRLRGVGPEVHGKLRLDAQKVAPFHRPIIRELVARQQPVYQDAALVRV